jgi:hypothetical protein
LLDRDVAAAQDKSDCLPREAFAQLERVERRMARKRRAAQVSADDHAGREHVREDRSLYQDRVPFLVMNDV